MMIRIWLAVVGVLLLLGGYLIIDDQELRNDHSRPQVLDVVHKAKHAENPLRKMEERFSVIVRDRASLPPALVRLVLRPSGLPRRAVERAFFQKVGEFRGDVWVMIADSRVCVAQLSRATASCEGANVVYRRGIALGMFQAPKGNSKRPTGFVVVGIAPDGKKSVTLMVGTKRQRRPITQNFYAAAANVPIKVLGLAG
jgi:hypothetical protein